MIGIGGVIISNQVDYCWEQTQKGNQMIMCQLSATWSLSLTSQSHPVGPGNLRTRLGEAEDIVHEKQHILKGWNPGQAAIAAMDIWCQK